MSTTTTAQLATSLLRQAATSLEAVGLHRGPGMWPGGRIYAQGAALSVDGAMSGRRHRCLWSRSSTQPAESRARSPALLGRSPAP